MKNTKRLTVFALGMLLITGRTAAQDFATISIYDTNTDETVSVDSTGISRTGLVINAESVIWTGALTNTVYPFPLPGGTTFASLTVNLYEDEAFQNVSDT